jgi:putative ABC transport system substrate-binding protein
MKRREFLGVVGGAAMAWPLAARAQQPAPPVIAFLWNGAAPAGPGIGPIRVVADALREFGLVEGRDYRVETRYAAGEAGRLPALAAELLAVHPAVVLLGGHVAAKAVQDLSRTTPIVIMGMNDPVAAGLVASLAHPGGNITGVSNMSEETQTKLVEILHEMLPDLHRITAITNPENLSLRPMLDALKQQAAALGISVDTIEVTSPTDLDPAFAAVKRQRPGALLAMQDAEVGGAWGRRYRAGARPGRAYRRDAIWPVRGGRRVVQLFQDIGEANRSVALLLSKILKGANPADLPVEQPTRFRLRINMRTAKVLGLTIPPSIPARADEVIE